MRDLADIQVAEARAQTEKAVVSAWMERMQAKEKEISQECDIKLKNITRYALRRMMVRITVDRH